LRNGTIVFNTQSVRSNMRGAYRRTYVGEIDYFAVHCQATDGVYFVPIEDAPGGQGRLRLAPAINNQAVGIRWAADYELPPLGSARVPDLHSADPPV
jgi:hypothetical protein